MKNKKGWKRWKRITASALALLLVSGGVDVSGFAVYAEANGEVTAVKKQMHVTAFERLDQKIIEQQLPVGASEDDIIFPETLTVMAEQTDESGAETKADTDMDTDKADVQDNDAIDADAVEDVQMNDAETGTDEDETDVQDDKDEMDAQIAEESADIQKEASSDEQSTAEADGEKADTERESDAKGSEDADDADDIDDTDADDIGDMADADADTEDAEDTDTDTDDMEAVDEETAFLEELFSVFTPLQVQAAGSDKKQFTLTDITWEIDPKESDGDTFDSSADSNGKCYVYVPILPDTDSDGNELCLAEDAELPMIYVLIGERAVRYFAGDQRKSGHTGI